MPLVIVDGIIQFVPSEGVDVIEALDGSGDTFSPVVLLTHSPDRESANVVRQRLNASISVLLRGDKPRSGSFDMGFLSDVEADRAAEILGRPCLFRRTSLERPALDMTFARSGRLGTTIEGQAITAWRFSVGFQEVSA